MSEGLTLMEALERFRRLNKYQTQLYREYNRWIRIYLWAVVLYPLYIVYFISDVSTTEASVNGVSVIGAIWTTWFLYRLHWFFKNRASFEQVHGLTTHRRAIRKFSLQKL